MFANLVTVQLSYLIVLIDSGKLEEFGKAIAIIFRGGSRRRV